MPHDQSAVHLIAEHAIGSFVLVIIAWLHQNQRLTDLRIDTQRQFDTMRSDTTRQFTEVQRQIGEVKSTLTTLSADYQNFYGLEQSWRAE